MLPLDTMYPEQVLQTSGVSWSSSDAAVWHIYHTHSICCVTFAVISAA